MGSLVSVFWSNEASEQVLLEACRSNDTRHLAYLIAENKFHFDGTKLVKAVEQWSLPVASLLLHHGVDVNFSNGLPLNTAIIQQNVKMSRLLLENGANPNLASSVQTPLINAVESRQVDTVRLLLDYGADLTTDYYATMRKAIHLAYSGSRDIFRVLLENGILLESRPAADETALKLAKYSRICKAILDNDKDQVKQLLEIEAYKHSADNLGIEYKLVALAVRLGGLDVIEAFLPENLKLAYFESARSGNLEALKLCRSFDSQIQDQKDSLMTLRCLQEACHFRQHEVIKFLINEHESDLGEPDAWENSLLFRINDYHELNCVLSAVPELNVNIKMKKSTPGVVCHDLLAEKSRRCDLYAVLLEHGASPPEANRGTDNPENFIRNYQSRHRCYRIRDCDVVRYLKKLWLLDDDYVKRIGYGTLWLSKKQFLELPYRIWDLKCELEINKMKNLRISQSISSVSRKTLFDFMFLKPNEAAHYSRNGSILKIYKSCQQDFRKPYPQYGFRLNFQLRRGMVRRDYLDSSYEFLCSVFGAYIPQEFSEFIFGHFSNRALKQLLGSK